MEAAAKIKARAAIPDIQHCRCFLQDDYQAVAELIQKQDPGHQCLIVVTAGTPCPDYSAVMDKSEGRKRPEGSKFGEFIDRLMNLRELPGHKLLTTAENVVMNHPSDCQYISDRLASDPIVLDPQIAVWSRDHDYGGPTSSGRTSRSTR